MAANPNPARITDQMWSVWEGFLAVQPTVELGGIYAPKPGYHGTRNENSPSNYSVAQYAIDQQGPGDKAAAIDLTFPDAQAEQYGTINKYSQRLLAAGLAGRDADPRTVYMREFYGNIDTDSEVEGWDYARHGAASSDSSHLWHIHISIHRGYVTDPEMVRAVLSILSGETVDQWRGSTEEDDNEMATGIIAVGGGAGVLAWVDPQLGKVYENIVTFDMIGPWVAAGWKVQADGSPFPVDSLDWLGREVSEARAAWAKQLGDAMPGGGSGNTGNATFTIAMNGTATPKG